MSVVMGLPLMNDIATNPQNPVEFEKIKELQANQGKDLSYPEKFAPLQKSHYPDIQPLILNIESIQVLDICLQIVKQRQWEIISFDEKRRKIEAVVTTNMMKFKDDIAIQLYDEDKSQTRIEMRSKSRIGKGDLGANAKRIKAFLSDLKLTCEKKLKN